MKKYIAFEIDIPDDYIQEQTEDVYLYDVANTLKSRILYGNGLKRMILFTGNWEFIDTPSPAIIETKEQWETRMGMKLP